MLGKILLVVSGLIFTGYGTACLMNPQLPADLAGLAIVSGDGFAELGAMYGGLQLGVGLFCLLCAALPVYTRPGLTLLCMGIGCLALARLVSAWDADWMVGGYTWGALAYEVVTAVLAGVALRRD
ncbi:DUF4345 domain-containing protein [Pseudohalioglobus sediminis]|uniref:DUF4345 domain-containing protein n=1 Tax=Pseudohalioglobus sediminis TaxID=2606449 RepID=A0A5B0X209_9GAMM|nr:DUF4345 family protein [Pseudohalioglobus sediminis]KAA1193242.1 DUF4345 domain-containing protein [Pseudohalioglobus sediminis]